MPGEAKFFSLNKTEDWVKGVMHNLEVAGAGLTLSSRGSTGENGLITKGTFISYPLDSLQDETVWSRIKADIGLADGAHIDISYYASDSKQIMVDGEPVSLEQFIRDMGISWEEKAPLFDLLFNNTVSNAVDALMINAVGRYLWIKVDIIGSRGQSPRLKALRLYMDSGSYLDYLPEIFQEDKESKRFLERFLAVFQSFFDDMEEDINYISNYFDPDIVPREFLEWLAGCVGIDNVKIWNEARLRKLIGNAYEIFRERGTRQGISDIVEYYTGEAPIIIEYFQYCDFMKDKEVGDILSRLYSSNPYEFNIFVRQEVVPDIESSLTLSGIIEWQKPAHTEARLVVLKPNICLNSYSFLGINTFLTEQTVLKIDNNTSLPYNTILIDSEENI